MLSQSAVKASSSRIQDEGHQNEYQLTSESHEGKKVGRGNADTGQMWDSTATTVSRRAGG